MSNIIIDIDGVLADCEHRLYHILEPDGSRKKKPDWEAFFQDCYKDTPIPAGCDLLDAIVEGCKGSKHESGCELGALIEALRGKGE